MPPSSNRPAPVAATATALGPSEPSNASATTTTTILRVKRRRDEPPCLPETLLLRTELLRGGGGGGTEQDGDRSRKRSRVSSSAKNRARDEQLADLLRGSALGMGRQEENGNGNRDGSASASVSGGKHTAMLAKSAAARFRRVPGGDLSSLAAASSEGEAGRRTCKRVRVVDAQIHREPVGDDGHNGDAATDAAAAATAAAAIGRDRSASDASGGGGGRRRSNKRARLVLDIVTARDVNGKDCDSDKLVNAGVEFWNSVASATANEAAAATTTSTSSNNKRLILDPATRAVDTSLRKVFHHEKTVLQHLTYLRTDPLLLSVAQPPPPPPLSIASTSRPAAASGGGGGGKWMTWLNHRGSASQNNTGTILHAAAIFNDVDGARLALELGIDATVVDGDDHTALAVAETVGSTGVVTLLQSSAVGGHGHGHGHGHGALEDEDDDADYVFDVYCLAGARESARERDDWDNWMSPADRVRARATSGDRRDPNEHHSEEVVDGEGVTKRSSSSTPVGNDAHGNHKGNTTSLRKSSSPDMSGSDDNNSSSDADECRVEIKGGMGYWNERGELVLEADKHSGGTANGNNDDHSYGEGDDHDSNDEAYEGNDYPEDEDDAMESDDENGGVRTSYGFGMGTSSGAEPYSSDEEGLALYGRSYRHDPIPAPATSGWSNIWSETTQMGDDSDDDRGHALSGFNMDDSDVGDDDEYGGPLGGSGMLGGSRQVTTYGEVGLYGEGGACAYDPEYDDAE